MKAGEVKLQQMLDGKVQYRVPLFQRTYNWREDEWERLWEDITELYMMSQPRSHFIGAIVTQPVPDAPERAAKHLLIDGQQRLTTLCILLASIRKKATESHSDMSLATEIDNTCLTNKIHNVSIDEAIKLRPTQRDSEAFSALVAGSELPPEKNNNVYSAFKYFCEVLEDGDPEGNPFDLPKLKNRITYYLDLVSITLDTADSAHKIFESLNNTGMQLGPSDLIRNYVSMHIPDESEAQRAYDQYWLPMQESLGSQLDWFFWRYLMMDGSLPRIDETYEEIRDHFKDLTPERATSLLVEFSGFSKHYARILTKAGSGNGDSFWAQMERLNRWEVDVAYPFIMKCLSWVDAGKITLQELVKAMAAIESFVIRRAICWVPTNRLRRIFANLCSTITEIGFVENVQQQLADNEWPSDKEFQEDFLEYPLYSSWLRRMGRIRLILESLESSYGEKETAVLDANITIEHVMPQSITEEWEYMLGPEAARVHADWLHTPGNLTLTAYNPELSNSPFGQKRDILSDSKFALSRDIVTQERWDEEAIKERGQALAERAVRVWARPRV